MSDPVAPPPKKRRRRRAPPAPVSPTQDAQFKACLRGFVLYLQSPGSSIRGTWEQGRLRDDDDEAPYIRDCVSFTIFQRIASEEKWVRKRAEHWDEVKGRVQSKLLDYAVQKELDEIGSLEGLKLVAMDHIVGNEEKGIKRASPRSLEGVMKAYIDLDKLTTEKRGRVTEHVSAAAIEQGEGIVAPEAGAPAMVDDDGFTDDEVLVMSEALAESRALKMLEDSQKEEEAPPEAVPESPFPTDEEVVAEAERLAERLAEEGRNEGTGNSADEEAVDDEDNWSNAG